jgi:anti-sigma factor RsiW
MLDRHRDVAAVLCQTKNGVAIGELKERRVEMNTESELRLQAYLDNEVSSSEARQIASWIARDAEAKALCEELQATKSLLAAENEQPVVVPESRDFYWSKIKREIERTEQEPAVKYTPKPWWMRLLAPAAGAALLAVFVFTSVSPNPHRTAAHQERSDLENGTLTFRAGTEKDGMTLVWISSSESELAAAAAVSDEEDFE